MPNHQNPKLGPIFTSVNRFNFQTLVDEGMTNRPSIFTYLVFGPGGVPVEGIARPVKIAAWRGPGATLGVQAKIRRVQVGLVFD
jgi:hypothetical protein